MFRGGVPDPTGTGTTGQAPDRTVGAEPIAFGRLAERTDKRQAQTAMLYGTGRSFSAAIEQQGKAKHLHV